MPDFTVIDGGGVERGWDREIAQQHFEDFVVALSRGLAGSDQSYRTTQNFFRFVEHAQKTQIPIAAVIDGAVACKSAHSALPSAEISTSPAKVSDG